MKTQRLRIIGGHLRGKRLIAIEGRDIRPTADRVREAVFNILRAHILDANVLDIFAGTGALGIEALSRGAAWAGFVEKLPGALQILRRNLQACGLEKRARIYPCDARRDLESLVPAPPPISLILMDPPYGRNLIETTLRTLQRGGSLSEGALAMVEHSVDEPLPVDLSEFQLMDQRRYGKTLVSFLEYML